MRKVAVLLSLLAAPAAAQIQSRPTEPPLVNAVNEAWYQLGEPIQFAGDVYHAAGATVFFDGNVMIRTGHYNGIPLYADATVEPYSVVLVPIGRGLMQPYERRRRGDVAGTTASRAPSFPVGIGSGARLLPQASSPPSSPPLPAGAIGVYTPEPSFVSTTGAADFARPAVGGMARNEDRVPRTAIASLRKPVGNDGVWITYGGDRWVSAGAAVALGTTAFAHAGDYAGFPVYTASNRPGIIYIPTRSGRVAPYKRK